MRLTEERARMLTEFLSADSKRAEKLLTLGVKEAVAEINAHGHDFTEPELSEYGKSWVASQNQMGDEALAAVSGGVGRDATSEDSVNPIFFPPHTFPPMPPPTLPGLPRPLPWIIVR